MAINLHRIAGAACRVVNDWQEMVFTKSETVWELGSSEPKITISTVTAFGNLQPLGTSDIYELGFDVNAHEYYRVIISLDATNLDRVRQLNSDKFSIGERKFRIVGKLPADDAGWREVFCYLDEVQDEGI